MAKKLTIRRVGGLLPTICLVVLLVIFLVFTWLGVVGIPRFALEKLEDLASENGVELRIGSASLDYRRGAGIRFKDLSICDSSDGEKDALICLPEADISVELRSLLAGEISPQYIRLKDAVVKIPLEDGHEHMPITEIQLTINQASNSMVRLSEASMRIDGIPVNISGYLNVERVRELLLKKPDEHSSTQEKDFQIGKTLAKLSPYAKQLRSYIQSQGWTAAEYPRMELDFEVSDSFHGTLRANAPAIRHKQYRFRDAHIELSYADEVLRLNKLSAHSILPDGYLSLQGEYQIDKNKLSFKINSDLPALYFAREFFSPDDLALLAQLPTLKRSSNVLKLKGELDLNKDNLVDSLVLSGQIEQENIAFSSTSIKKLDVSFYYDSNSFTIDQFKITLPHGELSAQAFLKSGYGQANLSVDLPSEDIIALTRGISPTALSDELLESLRLSGNIKLEVQADISTPDFIPGKSPLIHFLPDLRDTQLQLSISQLSYQEGDRHYEASGASIDIKLKGLNGVQGERPDHINSTQLSLRADKLRTSSEGETLELENFVTEILSEDISWGKDSELDSLILGKSSLFSFAQSVRTLDVAAEHVNLNLSNALNIRPFTKDQDYITSGALELQTTRPSALGHSVDKLDVNLTLADGSDLSGGLRVTCDEAKDDHLSFSLSWKGWQNLTISDIACKLSSDQIVNLLPEGAGSKYGIDLTGEILVKDASLFLHTENGQVELQSGQFAVEATGLKRTPVDIPALRQRAQDIDLLAAGSFLRDDAGDYSYELDELLIKHHSGEFRAELEGNTHGHIRLRGSNTIGLQYINALIGSYDAHTIIRDFKLGAQSQFKLTNIDATIDYTQGINIQASTDVHLMNVGFAIGAIIEDGATNGRERLNTSIHPDPFTYTREVQAQVVIDVRDKAHDKDDKQLPDSQRIIITNPIIVFDNAPWLKMNKISGVATDTELTGERVMIDILNDYIEIEGIQGELYPSYALGMFYSPLYDFLDELKLLHPVKMKVSKSEFPLVLDYKRPMYSTIEVSGAEGGFYRFAGIDIPIKQFTGFVKISDDFIELNRFNSFTWDGVADLNLRIGITGETSSLDGYVRAVNMNLEKIATSFDAELSPALCFADFRFRSPSTEVDDIEGYGQLKLRDGKLLELGIFSPIADLLKDLPGYADRYKNTLEKKDPSAMQDFFDSICSGLGICIQATGDALDSTMGKIPGINYLIHYGLRDADGDFTVKNGYVYTDNLIAVGSNMSVPFSGELNIDTLELRARLWPDLGSILNLALSPITSISEHIIDIELRGKVDDLKWRISAESPFKRKEEQRKAKP